MTCFKPLHAYKTSLVNKDTGKQRLKFVTGDDIFKFDTFPVPCGQCIGCRLDKSRQWATRIALEKQMHDDSIFLTLTYDDEHLPEDGSLNKNEISKFMKNLRRQLDYYGYHKKIRFFGCGEYGDNYSRPHYHLIIFGWRPKDAKRYKGDLFTSQFIEKIWKNGWCPFGNVTFESAAYVARYVCKKITGDYAEYFYDGLEPEFVRMSRMPGIAREWLEKFQSDVLRDDVVIIRNGIKCKPPSYFDKIFEEYYPSHMEDVKKRRVEEGKKNLSKDVSERGFIYDVNSKYSLENLEREFYEFHVLPVKEEVQKSKYKMLKRGYEDGKM